MLADAHAVIGDAAEIAAGILDRHDPVGKRRASSITVSGLRSVTVRPGTL